MMQVRRLKLLQALQKVPHSLTGGLSHSTGLVDAQHLLTVYRRADNAKINRAITSIIHAHSGVPRLKAASCVTHDFTLSQALSLLLCSLPNPVFLQSYGSVANCRRPAGKASQFKKLCFSVWGIALNSPGLLTQVGS